MSFVFASCLVAMHTALVCSFSSSVHQAMVSMCCVDWTHTAKKSAIEGTVGVLYGFVESIGSIRSPSCHFDRDHIARMRYFRRRVREVHSGTRGLVRPFKFTATVATHVRDASVVVRVLPVHVVQSIC